MNVSKSLGTLCLAATVGMGVAQERNDSDEASRAMAEMMEKMARYTQPGTHHELLERFVGTWKTETRFFMGQTPSAAELGEAVTRWQMDGRWLITEAKGQMMGRPLESCTLMGYDNFKQSYVATAVSSMDTAMNRSEGDLDPGGEVLLLYGTLDEYLTGEHDKMVKTVFRFLSEDKYVMEVHDLPIGEKNTKVVEITYTRK